MITLYKTVQKAMLVPSKLQRVPQANINLNKCNAVQAMFRLLTSNATNLFSHTSLSA